MRFAFTLTDHEWITFAAKSPEQLKQEEEDKKKKAAEEDRQAGNKIRRAFGLPELSEAQYADMIKAGDNGSQQCWGFKGFPVGSYGGYYSGGWEYGGGLGGAGWAGWGGAAGHYGGGGVPMVTGNTWSPAWGGRAPSQNIIDVKVPVKQVFSWYPRHAQRRRHRTARRYHQLVPASAVSISSGSSHTRSSRTIVRPSRRSPSARPSPAPSGRA